MDFKEELGGIKKAAEFVNNLLESKGFLESGDEDRLKFCSINYHQLMDFQLDLFEDAEIRMEQENRIKRKIILNEKLVKNDKHVLNTIYSLLRNLESFKEQKQHLLDKINEKQRLLDDMRADNNTKDKYIRQLEQENHKHVLKQKQADKSLESQKSQLISLNQYCIKLENMNKSLKSNHQVELRKKELEISNLKDKLLSRQKQSNGQLYILGTLDNRNIILDQLAKESSQLAFDTEVQKLMVDSSDLITNLTLSNGKNFKLLKTFNQYLIILNSCISRSLDLDTPNPPDPYTFFKPNEENNLLVPPDTEIAQTLVNLATTDSLKTDLIQNLAQLQQNIMAHRNGFYP